MARPPRLGYVRSGQCFFITSCTHEKRRLFQRAALAELFIETFLAYRDQGFFKVHAFVLLPDHFHCLITPADEQTIERCLQRIKGGFSARVKKEMDNNISIWQKGFTDRRIRDRGEYDSCLEYIDLNPLRAGLIREGEL